MTQTTTAGTDASTEDRAKLVFGCGYLGSRVAKRWQAEGAVVHVVTRTASRAAELRAAGFRPLIADLCDPRTLGELPRAETVLFAVGYDRSGDASIEEVYAQGLQNVLAAVPAGVRHVIYISSTGVYGDAQGAWVDETTAPDPQRAGGVASLAAEKVLAGDSRRARSAILRMAGIYGPGRVPNIGAIERGEPLAVPSAGWLNLIHVEDAAAVVVAAEHWLKQGQALPGSHTFCVSDGHPIQRRDYYGAIARFLGAPTPRFTTADAASPATSRARADKRIANGKLVRELLVRLRYPTYQEGLAAILGAVG